MWGAIEAGGTKFACAAGTGPDDLRIAHVPTGTPAGTMEQVIHFFRQHGPIEALGIGCFGPIDRARGQITATPKLAWRNFEFVAALGTELRVPVGFDTDVNAAALAEARWGAGRGVADFLYLTVGTGIGGGAIVNGALLHGTSHPEMGHARIPHNRVRDPFGGCCPYHGDCLEGLASGPALEARWGCAPELLPAQHAAWELEAHYLALGVVNLVCAFAPERILAGGGVMQQGHLFDLVRGSLADLMNGYMAVPEVTAPGLGDRAGVLGALALAEQAFRDK